MLLAVVLLGVIGVLGLLVGGHLPLTATPAAVPAAQVHPVLTEAPTPSASPDGARAPSATVGVGTGPRPTSPQRAGPERAGPERAGPERAGPERAGPEPTVDVPTVPGRVVPVPRAPVDGDPLSVLAALQRIRSAAYADGDPSLLRRVYPAGSELFVADRADYRRTVPADGSVSGLRFDLADPEVLSTSPTRSVLDVRVRRRAAVVVSGTDRRALPGRELGRMRVTLVRPSPDVAWTIGASGPAAAAQGGHGGG